MIWLLNIKGACPVKAISRSDKLKAYQKGRDAERDAAAMLTRRGYEILSRRFRSPAGEIDLVASKGPHLAIVEVKARRNRDEAAWSVTPRQQRRIAHRRPANSHEVNQHCFGSRPARNRSGKFFPGHSAGTTGSCTFIGGGCHDSPHSSNHFPPTLRSARRAAAAEFPPELMRVSQPAILHF
jgi:Holliday junction resolvase-like predicted endonuclease